MAHPAEVDVEDRPASRGSSSGFAAPAAAGSPWRRHVLLAAWVLIAVQLAVRLWVLDQRNFYGDDFEYGTLANEFPLFSADYLMESHDGHFMPAALLLSGTLARLFPLDWTAVTVVLLVLQLLASYAVLRLLRTIMGDRPAVLIPLAVYLFSPLGLGAFTWWAAAMNAVPLQIGLAWYAADALRLVRTGKKRYAVTGTLALVLALAFYERAVIVPALAGALVWLLHHAYGVRAPLRSALRDGAALWLPSLAVLAGWAWLFLSVDPADAVESPPTLDQALQLSGDLAWTLVPGLAGGPWDWGILFSGAPLAQAPDVLVTVSAVVLAVLVLWTSWRRRAGLLVWLLFAAVFAVGAVLVSLGRAGSEFSGVLALTYRYFATDSVVFALALGVLFALPRRGSAPPPVDDPDHRSSAAAPAAERGAAGLLVPAVVLLMTAAYLVGSAFSTTSYIRAWQDEPTSDYLDTALASLAAAGDEPMLDQDVPGEVLWAVAAPYNRLSRMFLAVEDRPPFADASYVSRILDEQGRLVPAQVVPGIVLPPGPVEGCGWPVPGGAPTSLPLGGTLFEYPWTAQLSYTSAAAGTLRVALPGGESAEVPIRQGAHTVYVSLPGTGAAIEFSGATEAMGLCIGSGLVGIHQPG